MSTLTLVEQTNPGAQSAGQQKIYPKVGGLARVDSTGVEKTMLDSCSIANVESIMGMITQFSGGL